MRLPALVCQESEVITVVGDSHAILAANPRAPESLPTQCGVYFGARDVSAL